MTITIGVAGLAEPLYDHEGFELEFVDVGSAHVMADGSTVYDYVGTRYKFNLSWQHITEAQKNALRARAAIKTSQSFIMSNDATTTYTVRVVENTWRESYIEDGGATERYNCELGLETVAVV